MANDNHFMFRAVAAAMAVISAVGLSSCVLGPGDNDADGGSDEKSDSGRDKCDPTFVDVVVPSDSEIDVEVESKPNPGPDGWIGQDFE